MRVALQWLAVGLLALSVASFADMTPEEEARLLAPRATDYQVKHQILYLGVAAAPAMLDQLTTPNKVLRFETKSILRWLTVNARPAETAGLRAQYGERVTDESPVVRETVAELLGLIGGEEILPLVRPLLTDEAACGSAAYAVNKVPGGAGTQMLVAALDSDSPAVRIALAKALADRGDAGAAKGLKQLAESKEAEVRIAAWNALAALGDPAGEGAIRAGAERGRRATKDAAMVALANLAGSYVKQGRSRDAKGIYVEILERAGARRPAPVAAIRAAAAGMGQIGGEADVPLLAGLLDHRTPTVQVAGVKALTNMPGDGASEALSKALQAESHVVRYLAITAFGARQGRPDVPALVQIALGDDPGLASAAYRALGKVSDASVAQAALKGMQSQNAMVKEAAVDGALGMARAAEGEGQAQQAIQLYTSVYGAAVNDEQRVGALEGMGRVGGLPTLPQVQQALDADGQVGQAAAGAYLGIAARVADTDKTRAIELYEGALSLFPPGMHLDMVAGRLRGLGVAIGSPQGFVTDWYVIGPFTEGDEAKGTAHPFAAQPPEVTKPVQLGGEQVAWQQVRTASDGRLDFLPLFARNTECSAYAYAEVVVEKEQDVYIKVGSDDGVAIFVNGEKLHENILPRGLKVDEDRVEAHLKAGANALLAHVQNGGGDFSLAVRITNLRNRPVRFKMSSQ